MSKLQSFRPLSLVKALVLAGAVSLSTQVFAETKATTIQLSLSINLGLVRICH